MSDFASSSSSSENGWSGFVWREQPDLNYSFANLGACYLTPASQWQAAKSFNNATGGDGNRKEEMMPMTTTPTASTAWMMTKKGQQVKRDREHESFELEQMDEEEEGAPTRYRKVDPEQVSKDSIQQQDAHYAYLKYDDDVEVAKDPWLVPPPLPGDEDGIKMEEEGEDWNNCSTGSLGSQGMGGRGDNANDDDEWWPIELRSAAVEKKAEIPVGREFAFAVRRHRRNIDNTPEIALGWGFPQFPSVDVMLPPESWE